MCCVKLFRALIIVYAVCTYISACSNNKLSVPRAKPNVHTHESLELSSTNVGEQVVHSHDVADKNSLTSNNLMNSDYHRIKSEMKGIDTSILNRNKKDAEAENLLPILHTCNATIRLHTLNLNSDQKNNVCDSLIYLDDLFHRIMETNYQPVEDDNRQWVDIYIFDNYSLYMQNVQKISGLSFNPRGGFFYEGDPSDDETSSTIFLFVSGSKPFSVWNLEHEYIHHLHARFIKYGFVDDHSPFLFWEEGLAEYFAKQNDNTEAINTLKSEKRLSLSQIFSLTYNDSSSQLYTWSYLAVRFLIEEQNTVVRLLVAALRHNQPKDFISLLDEVKINYDEAFQNWLNTLIDSNNTG